MLAAMRRSSLVLLALAGACCLPAAAAAAGPPTIEYLAPSPLRNHEATLRYTVDPEGLATEYVLEYGFEAGQYFPHTYPWAGELPAGEDPVLRTAEIPAHFEGGLLAGTEYHWRVVATNAAGTTEGPDQVFTTPNGPRARAVTLPATDQTLSAARLHGTVDPEGAPLTSCLFRYMKKSEYYAYEGKYGNPFESVDWLSGKIHRHGPQVPCAESLAEIGSGGDPVAVHADLSGLDPEPYVFRLEGENEFDLGVPGALLSTWLLPIGPISVPSMTPLSTRAPPPSRAKRRKHRRRHLRARLRHNTTIVAPR